MRIARPKGLIHKIRPHVLSMKRVRIALVGAGGNGSQMVSRLVQIDQALRSRNQAYLDVTVFDPDMVTSANVGRQLFYPSEVGINKAIALVQRANASVGTSWRARTVPYAGEPCEGDMGSGSGWHSVGAYHIVITCVDSGAARKAIYNAWQTRITERGALSALTPHYWLDVGNSRDYGQVVLGQLYHEIKEQRRLKNVIDLFPEHYDGTVPEDNEPSCSLAEALTKQDLFVNLHASAWACQMLWTLLSTQETKFHGHYFNLANGDVRSTLVTRDSYVSVRDIEKSAVKEQIRGMELAAMAGANVDVFTPTDGPENREEVEVLADAIHRRDDRHGAREALEGVA